ncbi:uracil/xanthine transporter [Metabacillus fastidiosus]|uniref:uracil/xanthine transporter n=1 Tax=Metabacillus fastidiosus TaxID=1458 RepID=UPI003D2E4BB6
MSKGSLTTAFGSVQWLFFIFANVVVVPISIGTAFGLPSEDIATILRSSLLFTGAACMLQGFIGHRYPIMEGPSGVVWGLILNLCFSASSMGMSLSAIGGGIATGMLLACAATILIAVCNLVPFVLKIFSPMVMTVYLFLLTFQLIIIFFGGMLKINSDGSLNLHITLFSFIIVAFVCLLNIKGNKMLSNFAILIGMIVGWIGYSLLFSAGEPVNSKAAAFKLFPLGEPNLEIGIIAITFLGCLINLSNTIASVQAVSKFYNEDPTMKQYRNSYLLTGVFAGISPLIGMFSYSPYASSIGFLESTRIFDRKPFLIGGGLMALLGVIPALGSLLATMPITIGNAVLFVAYIQLFGTSLKSLNGYVFSSKTIYRLAVPVLAGVCIMTIDKDLFGDIPLYIRPILSNGFIMGVLLSIALERVINWEKVNAVKSKNS